MRLDNASHFGKIGITRNTSGRGSNMTVKYSKNSLKFLSKLDRRSIERIRNAIHGLTLKPPQGDIKFMQGYSDERKRLRIGSWRVIYKYDSESDALLIIDIGNRGDIYK